MWFKIFVSFLLQILHVIGNTNCKESDLLFFTFLNEEETLTHSGDENISSFEYHHNLKNSRLGNLWSLIPEPRHYMQHREHVVKRDCYKQFSNSLEQWLL